MVHDRRTLAIEQNGGGGDGVGGRNGGRSRGQTRRCSLVVGWEDATKGEAEDGQAGGRSLVAGWALGLSKSYGFANGDRTGR